MKTDAQHLLAEYWGCPADVLDDEEALRTLVVNASVAAGCTVLSVSSHSFSPVGVTVMALLSESHASIHTWPERGYAAVDVYTCGDGDPRDAHPVFEVGLAATSSTTSIVQRGTPPTAD